MPVVGGDARAHRGRRHTARHATGARLRADARRKLNKPDVKSVRVEGPIQPGMVFRWKAGPSSLTSTLQVVNPPSEIAWTGTTMGIKAVHVFRFQASDGGTLARSEESGRGCWPACSRATAARP
jgi:hypothetical protein